jgi:drug/metabolite transporter (DMT)-like permease
MNKNILRTDLILLVSALIWGFAFVAQRAGMKYVGPFTFNGIRFILGALFLLPLIRIRKIEDPASLRKTIRLGLPAGIILFTAAALQQVGIVYTSAGNAGFITGLYMIFVPVLGLISGRKTGAGIWLGVIFAATGMYLLTTTSDLAVSRGNFLVLISAVCWALHVLTIDRFTKLIDPLRLAFTQFLICGILSGLIAIITEKIELNSIFAALIPILYGGLISVGIGFTLQVVAQKEAHPSHAALILSLEAVFAFLGGIVILQEILTGKRIVGCLLMLTGMVISQLWQRKKRKKYDLDIQYNN